MFQHVSATDVQREIWYAWRTHWNYRSQESKLGRIHSMQFNAFFLNVMFAVFLVSWFRCESGGKEEKHSFCGVALRPAIDHIKSPQIWYLLLLDLYIYMFMIYKMIGQCVSENLFSNTSWPTCGDGSKTLALTADEKKMGPYKMVSWLWVEHWEPLVVRWCLMHFVRVGSIKDKAMVSRLIILQMLALLAIKACDYLSEFSSPGVASMAFVWRRPCAAQSKSLETLKNRTSKWVSKQFK